MSPIITWFEIPSMDFERAIKFYDAIFQIEITKMTIENHIMGVFPVKEGGMTGAIVNAPSYSKPSDQGVNVYFNAGDNIDGILERVEKNWGKIIVPKMAVGDMGQMAWIMDSEGNRIALQQLKK